MSHLPRPFARFAAYSAGLLGLLLIVSSLRAEDAPVEQRLLRTAAGKALPLLEKSSAEFTQRRGCFSCHHQTVPLLAFTLAEERGFSVAAANLQHQVKFTEAFLRSGKEAYLQGRGQGGQATTAGYGLWALDLGGCKPDETTAAVAEYLLRWNADLGFWRPQASRPPTESSPFTTSYVALRGLRRYGTTEQAERIAARIARARDWLVKTPAVDTEDRVFRLLALREAGAPDAEVKAAAQQLAEMQRPDGGWSQNADLPTDAYATGTALTALELVGGMTAASPPVQRGLRFLLQAQEADGSWHVGTRSRPIQAYFESGFPHGKDQFISISATGWAAAALMLACDAPAG